MLARILAAGVAVSALAAALLFMHARAQSTKIDSLNESVSYYKKELGKANANLINQKLQHEHAMQLLTDRELAKQKTIKRLRDDLATLKGINDESNCLDTDMSDDLVEWLCGSAQKRSGSAVQCTSPATDSH